MLIIVPEVAVTVTVKETDPLAPAASVPIFQMTTPLANEPPLVAETNETPLGRRSLTETPVAPPPVLLKDSV